MACETLPSPSVTIDTRRFNRRFWYDMWVTAGEELIPIMECGWCDGGCWRAAEGIKAWIDESDDGCGRARLAVIVSTDDPWTMRHFVVELSLMDGGRRYLDAYGIATASVLLRRWRTEERISHPRIAHFDPGFHETYECPRNPAISVRVAAILGDAFGVFRWTCLADPPPLPADFKRDH